MRSNVGRIDVHTPRIRLCAGVAVAVLLLGGCVATPTREGAKETQPVSAGYVIEEAQLSPELEREFARAVQLLVAEDYATGVEVLTKLTMDPKGQRNTAPFINLAIAHQKLGKLEDAEKNLKKALALIPGHPVANNEYGLLLRRTGRFAEARTVYERVLGNYPDYLPARKNLAILCDLYLRDFACALENYEIYSAAVPGDTKVPIWIADIKNRIGS